MLKKKLNQGAVLGVTEQADGKGGGGSVCADYHSAVEPDGIS